jgi:hypothetical protein
MLFPRSALEGVDDVPAPTMTTRGRRPAADALCLGYFASDTHREQATTTVPILPPASTDR